MLYLNPEIKNVCLQVFKIAWSQEFMVSCCQDFLVSWFQECMSSRFQGVKISWRQKFMVSWFQEFNFYWSQLFIYSIIKYFFQSFLIYCYQESSKAIFQANKNIKSTSFSICPRLALSDLFCPISNYGKAGKQILILRCHETREYE